MGEGKIDLGRFTWPPPRFDPAAARREAETAQRPGALSAGLQASTQLLAATNGALGKLGSKHLPVAVLAEWQASLPAKAAPGVAPGLARDLDAALLPLLDGARGELTRGAAAQRAAEDRAAAVGWMNQGARLAAVAPAALTRQVVARLGARDPTLGKLFQDKVAYHQVLRDLERDASLDLAADPRLAGVAPEVLADLTADRARLAREQGESQAVTAAGRRVEVSRALAYGMREASRGVAGPPLSRTRLLELYGLSEGATLWELWQAGQAKVPAYALVRGKSREEIAAAKAGYAGDVALLARVEQEDAAERRRDPAGYGLTWAKGYRAAYDGSRDPAERAALLWEAQGAAGIPERERSPWTAEQGWALGERWQAAGEGLPHQVALARVRLLRETLMSLPPEQRDAGVETLERLGLAQQAGQLRLAWQALDEGNISGAYLLLASGRNAAKSDKELQVAGLVIPGFPLPLGIGPDPEQAGRALEQFVDWAVEQFENSDKGTEAEAILDEVRSLAARNRDLAGGGGGATFDQLPPEKPEEPRDFDTEEAARIAKEFFGPLVTPADLAPIFQLEGFSLDEFIGGAISEIFPNSSHELPQITVLESRGNERTQWHVSKVGETVLRILKKVTGQKAIEWFGGEVGKAYRKELHLTAPEGGRKNYGRPDFSVQIPGTDHWLHINTVDADRFGNPTSREHNSALRILRNTSVRSNNEHLGDVVVLLPKLRAGETYDETVLEQFLEDLVRAMASPDWEFRWSKRQLDKNYKLIR